MLAAEAIFAADSPAVAGMLELTRQRTPSFDLTTLAVVSIDDLLHGLGLRVEERTEFYRQVAVLSPDGGKVHRTRQRELRRLLGRPAALTESAGGDILVGLLAAAVPPSSGPPHRSAPWNEVTSFISHVLTCGAAMSTFTPTGCSARMCRMNSLCCSCCAVPARGLERGSLRPSP